MRTYAAVMPVGRASMRGLVRSEWMKLRTVRSTLWTLGTTAFVGLGASAIAMGVTRARWATEPAANKAAFDPIEVSLVGVYVGGALTPVPHATLSSPGALRAVAGTGLFLCVVGLFALGIAVVVRNTAGAISAYVGVLLVLPIIVEAVPDPAQYQIERLLPMSIGSAMINDPAPHGFGPWLGLSILCGYAVLVLAVGTLLFVRRDA